MSENGHWVDQGDTKDKFLQFVRESGLDKKAVLALFKEGQTEQERAKALEALDLHSQEVLHSEARAGAYSDMYAPDGLKINVWARQGADVDTVLQSALAVWEASKVLRTFGFGHVVNGRQPARQPTQQGNGSQWPETTTTQGNGNGSGDKYIDTEFIKIGTDSKDNPCVEFWRPGRQYAEIKWNLGVEDLLALVPWLAERDLSITVENPADGSTVTVTDPKRVLAIPGKTEHPVRCRVFYVLSDKTNSKGKPYKDIVRVEPR